MKKLLMVLTISAFSFAVMAQTSTDPSSQGSGTEIMGAQEEVYPEGTTPATTPQEEEENVNDPSMQTDSSIQEEVDTESEESMRSDTMEGTDSMGTEGSLEGSSTP